MLRGLSTANWRWCILTLPVQIGPRSSGERAAREYVQDQGGLIFTARQLRGLACEHAKLTSHAAASCVWTCLCGQVAKLP